MGGKTPNRIVYRRRFLEERTPTDRPSLESLKRDGWIGYFSVPTPGRS